VTILNLQNNSTRERTEEERKNVNNRYKCENDDTWGNPDADDDDETISEDDALMKCPVRRLEYMSPHIKA
jgi:hypothetical protein